MTHIFISYSHKDKVYAHKLHRHLLSQGFDVWIDDRIDYGSHWPREIEMRLKECIAFILVMSPNSYESEWVQNELSFARQLNRPIFPLLLDGNVWWHLQTTQYVDVKGGKLPPIKFFVRLAEMVPHHEVSSHMETASLASEDDKKKEQELELKKLESQAIQFELSGNFWNALQVYYKIKSIDQLFPSVDIKISELEAETHPKQKETYQAQPERSKPAYRRLNTQIVAAIIGAIAIIIGAIISSPALVSFINRTPEPTVKPNSTGRPTPIRTLVPTPTKEKSSTPVPTFTQLVLFDPHPNTSDYVDAKGVPMRLVPAGEFMMGVDADNAMTECKKYATDCQRDQFADAEPLHKVEVNSFYIDKYEVTNALYKACVEADVCQPPENTSSWTHSSYYGNAQYNNYPVIFINWNMAKAYCEWRGARLPTEAEWEKAARGNDGRIYPWRSGLDCDKANYGDCVGDTVEIGSYESGKSPYGVYDLAGNAWEWVSSLYKPYPYLADDGRENLNLDGDRVFRGGGWSKGVTFVPSFFRIFQQPNDATSADTSFRCAFTP